MTQPLFANDDDAMVDSGPVIAHRAIPDTGDLDITPMIDITFLLLIFFLVCSTTAIQSSVDLAPARHGKGVSSRTSIIVTVADAGDDSPAKIYLADGTSGSPLAGTPDQQMQHIAAHVHQEYLNGKSTVLVKAEKSVRHREVARVAEAVAAAEAEGIKLHLAVVEIE